VIWIPGSRRLRIGVPRIPRLFGVLAAVAAGLTCNRNSSQPVLWFALAISPPHSAPRRKDHRAVAPRSAPPNWDVRFPERVTIPNAMPPKRAVQHRLTKRAAPRAKYLIRSPIQGFVQVAEIASIRTSTGEIIRHARAADLMAPNGFEYAVSSVWHVAVITLASA